MASAIDLPTSAEVGAFATEVADDMVERGDYDARVAAELIAGLTTAKSEITALQAGTSIAGVNGTTIAAGGALTIGQVLRATAAGAAGWGAVDLANVAAVTGLLPAANVAGVNGAAVSVAGSLTTGNGLYVSGVSALTYSALNLAGGANFVTGVLPGANQALAVAASTQGAITGADKTHINATMHTQVTTGTLVSGTATINSVIVVAANSEIVAYPDGAITGSTNFGCLQELRASRGVGGAGVGSIVIQAVGADGLIDSDAAGAFHALIMTPHA